MCNNIHIINNATMLVNLQLFQILAAPNKSLATYICMFLSY